MSEFDGHTPGPWWAEDEHGFTAIRSSAGGVCVDAMNEEDARLIAAAPDLLAQRDALLEALHEIAAATDGAEAHLTIWIWERAEAAIAKVRRGKE